MASFSEIFALVWHWFPFNDSFFLMPFLSMIFNVILAVLLSMLVTRPDPEGELVQKAIRMMNLVSNASISIVTLTFSLTVLSVQVASQTYTPRLIDDFVKDPLSKMVISVNLGAYVFCFTLNYFIDDSDNIFGTVPHISVHLLSVHIALILLSFVSFIHLFINGFRLEVILSKACNSSLNAAYALTSTLQTDCEDDEDGPEAPPYAFKVYGNRSGYANSFQLSELLSIAHRLDIVIKYTHQIGDFVNEGALICYVWDAKTRDHKQCLEDRVLDYWNEYCNENDCEKTADDEGDEEYLGKDDFSKSSQGSTANKTHRQRKNDQTLEQRLSKLSSEGLTLSKKRDGSLDVTLGLQQVCDIAVRALSPGVNDPHTAVQCLDVLSTMLAQLGNMDLSLPSVKDSDGVLRLCAPRRSFSHLVSLLDPIRGYGGNDVGVCRRGIRLFGDLAMILTRSRQRSHVPVLMAQLEQWMVVSRENFKAASPERKTLEDLYNHAMASIATCKDVRKGDSEEKELQDLEVTHKDEDGVDPNDNDGILDGVRKIVFTGELPPLDSADGDNDKEESSSSSQTPPGEKLLAQGAAS